MALLRSSPSVKNLPLRGGGQGVGLSTWRGAKFQAEVRLESLNLMLMGRSMLRPYLPLGASRPVSACADTLHRRRKGRRRPTIGLRPNSHRLIVTIVFYSPGPRRRASSARSRASSSSAA